MAEDVNAEGYPSEIHQELYIPVRTLGRGAFGEAVLYRKKEVEFISSVLILLLLNWIFKQFSLQILKLLYENSFQNSKQNFGFSCLQVGFNPEKEVVWNVIICIQPLIQIIDYFNFHEKNRATPGWKAKSKFNFLRINVTSIYKYSFLFIKNNYDNTEGKIWLFCSDFT